MIFDYIFDLSKDDLMLDKWIAHVDQIVEEYNWVYRIIVRLIASRLCGHTLI